MWWLLLVGCAGTGVIPVESTDADTDADADSDADTDTDADSDADADTDPPAPLPLVINEVAPDNTRTWTDASGGWPDWIELYNPTAAAVSLAGWTITDDREVPDRHALDAALVVPAGGHLLLIADGLPDAGPEHLGFSLSAGGEEVGLYAPDGRGTVVSWGPLSEDVTVARVPDGCAGDGCWRYPWGGTPGAPNVQSSAQTPLISAGAIWRYLDDGAMPGAWRQPGFDDDGWASGPAPLGYGDAPATIVGYGPDPLAKHPTTLLRASFTVADPSAIDALRLRVRRDDGVAVYLNGVPIFRHNLPANPGPAVYAAERVEGLDEGVWLEASVWTGALRVGENVLAAEVHLFDPADPDLSFDLELLSDP